MPFVVVVLGIHTVYVCGVKAVDLSSYNSVDGVILPWLGVPMQGDRFQLSFAKNGNGIG